MQSTQSLPSRDFQFFNYSNAPSTPPPLAVKASSSWTYCGPLLPITNSASNLPSTFHAWSAHTLSSSLLPRLLPFLAAVHDLLRSQGLHHYWITVRASRPTPDFDEPRWHTDDHFFDPTRSDSAIGFWKLCTTLLGPGTLFAADGHRARKTLRSVKADARKRQKHHVCLSIRCAACGKTSDEVRKEMARRLEEAVVVQPVYGEAAFFRVGGKEGAVHSEPRTDCDRVFVNVVPGREDELKGLMARWGLEFPRSWCLGVPLVFGEDVTGTDRDRVRKEENDTTAQSLH